MAASPRPQTVAIFVVCVLVVAGAAVYASSASPRDGQLSLAINPTMPDTTLSTSTDWQKSFLAVSSTSSAFQTPAQTRPSDNATSAPLTATDLLGMEFFSAYGQLQQAGLDTDNQAVTDNMNQLASDSIANLPSPMVYTTQDIHILKNADPITTETYGKIVLTMVSQYMPAQNEAVVAESALEKGDMTVLQEIDPIIADYKNLLRGLLETPVPEPLAQYHLDLVNGASIALYNAESLRQVDTDPVQGLGALNLELTGLGSMQSALAGMQSYFASAGIPFGT